MIATFVYEIGIWVFMTLTLMQIGFFMSAIINAHRISIASRAWRVIFVGTILTRVVLVWLAWEAKDIPRAELTSAYWLALLAGAITLAGLIDLTITIRRITYGRRHSDVLPFTRRRDD